MSLSRSPITLTPAEHLLATLLVHGASTADLPSRSHLERSVVDTNLRGLRRKLNCVGASPTVLVHQLITQKLVPQPPVPEGPVPLLSQLQRDLLTALVTQPTQKAVAATVFMGVSKLQTEIDRLQAATGSTDRIQIVVRAHGWGLLRSSGTATATVVGAGR